MNKLLITLLTLSSCLLLSECSSCYDNWSRCTPQTAFWTGILWKSCPQYCKTCRGRADGACKRVHYKKCSGGFQCRCSGRNVPRDANFWEKATCKLGL